MQICEADGCDAKITKAGHRLCYKHWKMQRDGKSVPPPPVTDDGSDNESDGALLSSTKLGQHFGLSARRMNLVLSELGWIEKYVKGWTPTERGNQLGAQVREIRRSGIPYAVWPTSILTNNVLIDSVKDVTGDATLESESSGDTDTPAADSTELSGFRERFPAKFRATDGHMVRSRAEMLIDNWLYMQGIVHAFERKLPIEEEVYCDFYLPTGKVYVEYWGLENDPKYAARKQQKLEIYRKYNLNLVELGDDQIMNLDDYLPRMLLRHNIDCT